MVDGGLIEKWELLKIGQPCDEDAGRQEEGRDEQRDVKDGVVRLEVGRRDEEETGWTSKGRGASRCPRYALG